MVVITLSFYDADKQLVKDNPEAGVHGSFKNKRLACKRLREAGWERTRVAGKWQYHIDDGGRGIAIVSEIRPMEKCFWLDLLS